MRRRQPRTLENAVIGLFVALALTLGYFGLKQRASAPGFPERPSRLAGSPSTARSASRDSGDSETESAVSALPALKVTSARSSRPRRRLAPPPAPLP